MVLTKSGRKGPLAHVAARARGSSVYNKIHILITKKHIPTVYCGFRTREQSKNDSTAAGKPVCDNEFVKKFISEEPLVDALKADGSLRIGRVLYEEVGGATVFADGLV